jgi:hypothetical protein
LPLPFKVDFLSTENIEETICSAFSEKNRNVSDYYLKADELISFIENPNFTHNYFVYSFAKVGGIMLSVNPHL